MVSVRHFGLLAFVCASVELVHTREVLACSTINRVAVLAGPFEGELAVPTNARIAIVLAGDALGTPTSEAGNFELERVEANGSTTPVSTSVNILSNVTPSRVEFALQPSSALSANARYQVVDKTGSSWPTSHTFATGAGPSDAGAPAPTGITSSAYAATSCGIAKEAEVRFNAPDAGVPVSYRFEEPDGSVLCASAGPALGAIVSCNGVAPYDDLGISWPLAPGPHTLSVRIVTRTGEISAPVDVTVNVDCANMPDAALPELTIDAGAANTPDAGVVDAADNPPAPSLPPLVEGGGDDPRPRDATSTNPGPSSNGCSAASNVTSNEFVGAASLGFLALLTMLRLRRAR